MQSTQPDLDDLFHALSRGERRLTLRYLDSQNAPVAVDEVAAALAADQQSHNMNEDQIMLALAHQHFPLLEDTHLVERTSQDRVVTTDAASAAIDVLNTVRCYLE